VGLRVTGARDLEARGGSSMALSLDQWEAANKLSNGRVQEAAQSMDMADRIEEDFENRLESLMGGGDNSWLRSDGISSVGSYTVVSSSRVKDNGVPLLTRLAVSYSRPAMIQSSDKFITNGEWDGPLIVLKKYKLLLFTGK